MTEEVKCLVESLREYAEWARGNEWETPITLGDNLTAAADMIENLSADRDEWQRRSEAAEHDIDHCCSTCQYHYVFFNGCTPDHDCTNPDGGCTNNHDRWNWRGPCEGKDGTT